MAALTQRLELAAQQPLRPRLQPQRHRAASRQQRCGGQPDAAPTSRHEPAARRLQASAAARRAVRAGPGSPAAPRWGCCCALQVINHWRDALAALAATGGAALRRAYAAMGVPLDPHWDLSAYDVRQQGAVADPADSQLIRVRLSLANHAARAQPLPLLRLTLLDRYGKRIAAQRSHARPVLARRLAAARIPRPDERVDSEVAVRDPSAASASFELDVCLRNAARRSLHCAGDAARRRASVRIGLPIALPATRACWRRWPASPIGPSGSCAASSARRWRRRKCSAPISACGARASRSGAWTTTASPSRGWCSWSAPTRRAGAGGARQCRSGRADHRHQHGMSGQKSLQPRCRLGAAGRRGAGRSASSTRWCARSSVPVTLKIRTGTDPTHRNAPRVAAIAQPAASRR